MGADAILYDYLWSQIDKIFAGDAGLRSAMAALRRMAASTGTAGGRNGFTFGLLYAREVHIADESRRAAGKLI